MWGNISTSCYYHAQYERFNVLSSSYKLLPHPSLPFRLLKLCSCEDILTRRCNICFPSNATFQASKSVNQYVYNFLNLLLYLIFSASFYEGWNFNFCNAAVTFDTAHLQSSYFHRPSMYSPKLCRTRSQRWGSRIMPLAAPVLLMVRTERSTAEGLNPPCNCPIR